MALIVHIYVNSEHIGTESAVRIKGDTRPSSINTYELGSNKKRINHRYGDGAAKLAEKMMRNLSKQEARHGLSSYR